MVSYNNELDYGFQVYMRLKGHVLGIYPHIVFRQGINRSRYSYYPSDDAFESFLATKIG